MPKALLRFGKTIIGGYLTYQAALLIFAIGMMVGEAWTMLLLCSPKLISYATRLL